MLPFSNHCIQVFVAKSSELLRSFFQEVIATHVESGQPSQLFQLYEFGNNLQSFYSYLCYNILKACWYLNIVCKVLRGCLDGPSSAFFVCKVLYIRNIIKVDGVFVSYNLFYIPHSCDLLRKHICNFQYPNIKTKKNFIDVDYGIYILEACPFCWCVKEVFTKFDLSVEVLFHHFMHYKPIWISSMDACNQNHEIYEIICAKWGGVFRCIHVPRALFAIRNLLKVLVEENIL